MKENNNRMPLLMVSSIFFFVLLGTSINFFTPYLWYDEAGQFWIAKGLNHDSDPLSPANGLNAVIENNRSYNLDPGGFSIVLHFWSLISNNHVWLRLLPFLFFLGVVVSFIYLFYVWLKDMKVALLLGFILIAVPRMVYIGFEVRAYSMECLGTILCIIALEQLKNKLTNKHLFLWALLFAFFMTSRYSEILVVAVVSLYVLFLIYQSDKAFKEKLLSVALYSLPLIISLSYSYFFALQYQSEGSGIKPLYYLKYLSTDKSLLLVPLNFFAFCIVGAIPVLFIFKKKYPVIQRYETLLFVTFVVNIIFIALSFMGKYPWDMQSTRSISPLLLLTLTFSAFLGEILIRLLRKPALWKYSLILFFLLILLLVRKNNLFSRYQNRHNSYYTFRSIDWDKFHRIYADRWESPCIRYLFEYGALKSEKATNYPDKFTFAKFGPSCSKTFNNEYKHFYSTQPQMKDLLGYDLLIVPELVTFSTKLDHWKLIEGTNNFYIQISNQSGLSK